MSLSGGEGGSGEHYSASSGRSRRGFARRLGGSALGAAALPAKFAKNVLNTPKRAAGAALAVAAVAAPVFTYDLAVANTWRSIANQQAVQEIGSGPGAKPRCDADRQRLLPAGTVIHRYSPRDISASGVVSSLVGLSWDRHSNTYRIPSGRKMVVDRALIVSIDDHEQLAFQEYSASAVNNGTALNARQNSTPAAQATSSHPYSFAEIRPGQSIQSVACPWVGGAVVTGNGQKGAYGFELNADALGALGRTENH